MSKHCRLVAIHCGGGETQGARRSNLYRVLVIETHSVLAHHGQIGRGQAQLGRQVAGVNILRMREEAWKKEWVSKSFERKL